MKPHPAYKNDKAQTRESGKEASGKRRPTRNDSLGENTYRDTIKEYARGDFYLPFIHVSRGGLPRRNSPEGALPIRKFPTDGKNGRIEAPVNLTKPVGQTDVLRRLRRQTKPIAGKRRFSHYSSPDLN